MVVKSVTVLLILMALVAGVAVSASRAGPTAGPSAVLERCLSTGPGSTSYHCQPMRGALDERLDADNHYLGDNIGGDSVGMYSSDPEKRWADLLQFVADILDAAAKALDALTYGAPVDRPSTLTWVDELFDTSLQ
jgi:hypothetical protein